MAAYWYELLGDAGDQAGQTKSYSGRAYREYIHEPEGGWGGFGPGGVLNPEEPDDWIDFTVTATSGYVTWHWEKYRTNYAWIDYKWVVTGSSGDWNVNDSVFHAVQIPTTGNPYTFDWPEPLDGSDDWNGGMELQVNEIEILTDQIGDEEGRIFERFSGVADISFYEEVTLSNEGQAEHRISYVNLINDNPPDYANYQDLSLLGLVLQSNRRFQRRSLRCGCPTACPATASLLKTAGPATCSPTLPSLLTDKDNGAERSSRRQPWCEPNGRRATNRPRLTS